MGIKKGEIEDFLSKAEAVEAAIKGMRDGTVDPNNIKIEGIDSPEEIAEKERQKQQRLAEIKAKNEALALERKKEEKKRWWDGVDIMVPLNAEAANNSSKEAEDESDAENFHRMRYNSNYSRWDQWIPSDPATRLEQEELLKLEEKKRNEEFEKNNKEFCEKYVNDLAAREKEKNKRVQGSDSSRLRGNNYFKLKRYEDALKCYMDALKDQPYEAKILINIAQVYIKWNAIDDALEFLSRVLRVDPTHTKGLSRMAHVLSLKSQHTEALKLAKKALETDTDNTDLQRQVFELELAVQTKNDEDDINKLKEKACGGSSISDRTAIEETLRAEKDPALVMKKLEEALEMPLLATGFELLDKFVEEAVGNSDINAKCQKLLQADKNMRVYFRTNGALKLCLDQIINYHETLSNANASTTSEVVESLCALLQLLCAACNGESANMAAVCMELPEVVQFFTGMLCAEFKLSTEVMQVINLIYCDAMASTPSVLFGYKAALTKVSDFLGSAITSIPLQNDRSLQISCFKASFLFVKTYLFHSYVKSPKCVFPLSKSSCNALVENIALSLQVLQSLEGNRDVDMELAMEALLGCSQYSIMRGCFGESIRAINITFEVSCPTPLHVLSLLSTEKYRRSSYLHLCLGILMNICVSDEEENLTMKDKIVQTGCLPLLVDIVTASVEQRAQMDPLVLSRGVGLLARVASSPLAADTMKAPELYRKLCQRLAENINLPDRSEKWILDECGHLVRIIASLPSLPQDCLNIAFKEKLVESILRVFPSPRKEMGEITPSSVVLPPSTPIAALIIGNAARCLMPLADDAKNGEILFKKAGLSGVEKLICSLANCTDMRVRKNIAILLAKGARVPEVRAKIESFRGMQMLVELQKHL